VASEEVAEEEGTGRAPEAVAWGGGRKVLALASAPVDVGDASCSELVLVDDAGVAEVDADEEAFADALF
jgi:hypothetical protein